MQTSLLSTSDNLHLQVPPRRTNRELPSLMIALVKTMKYSLESLNWQLILQALHKSPKTVTITDNDGE